MRGWKTEVPRGKNAPVASLRRSGCAQEKMQLTQKLNKTKQSEGQKLESPRLQSQEKGPYYRISGDKNEDRSPVALETRRFHVLPYGL